MPASFRNGVDEQLRPALDVGFVILLRLVHGLRFITVDLQVAGTGENGGVDSSDGRVAGMQPARPMSTVPPMVKNIIILKRPNRIPTLPDPECLNLFTSGNTRSFS